MVEIKLLDDWQNLAQSSPKSWDVPAKRKAELENWYAEPFTKRKGCGTPGQCGGDCDCGCPYNTMGEVDRLPIIAEIAKLFPNEWLGFIISAEEDEDFEPLHGKLVAHSRNPDELYDAMNTVLWNQHVYIYFNGTFEAMQASYGTEWQQPTTPPQKRVASGPKQILVVAAQLESAAPLPTDLLDLVHSALDKLYNVPNLNEAMRRLRLARVRAAKQEQAAMLKTIDEALNMLEGSLPRIDEIIWFLEESLDECYVN